MIVPSPLHTDSRLGVKAGWHEDEGERRKEIGDGEWKLKKDEVWGEGNKERMQMGEQGLWEENVEKSRSGA